jgi:hypothetical protein
VFCKYKPAEVFVFSQEYPVLGPGKIHQIAVDRTALKFRYREDIVAVCAENSNRGKIAALVREETHEGQIFSET